MENSQVSHKRGYENLGSCNGYLKFDYCNSLLYGINQYLIAKLQRVQNANARLIMQCHRTTHTSSILKELNWLPIKDRVIIKVHTVH